MIAHIFFILLCQNVVQHVWCQFHQHYNRNIPTNFLLAKKLISAQKDADKTLAHNRCSKNVGEIDAWSQLSKVFSRSSKLMQLPDKFEGIPLMEVDSICSLKNM